MSTSGSYSARIRSQKIYLCVLVLTLVITLTCAAEVNGLEIPNDDYSILNEPQVEYTQVVYSSHVATEEEIDHLPGETVHEKITYIHYTDGSCVKNVVDLGKN